MRFRHAYNNKVQQPWNTTWVLSEFGKLVDKTTNPELSSSYRSKTRTDAKYRLEHIISLLDEITPEQAEVISDACETMMGSYVNKRGAYFDWAALKKKIEDTGLVVLKNCNSIW